VRLTAVSQLGRDPQRAISATRPAKMLSKERWGSRKARVGGEGCLYLGSQTPATGVKAPFRTLRSVESDNAVGSDGQDEDVARGKQLPGSRVTDTDQTGALRRPVTRVPVGCQNSIVRWRRAFRISASP
jgi:hypothetical protein